MREILSAIGIAPLFPTTMGADEITRWRAAAEGLPSPVFFDALQTAALSAILIPEEGGKALDADCNAARSLILQLITALKPTPEAASAYGAGLEGFAYASVAEQIDWRIETTCGK